MHVLRCCGCVLYVSFGPKVRCGLTCVLHGNLIVAFTNCIGCNSE